jgi:uncharacterized repeat protein (TIGR01451 family)
MWIAGLVCSAALFLAATAQAATLTVTRPDDPASATCTPANCSLRAAIAQANVDGGNDTIAIRPGTYQLSNAAGGYIGVTARMTLAGAGARSVTIVPAAGSSALWVSSGAVAINGLTFANSTVTGNRGAISAIGTAALALNDDRFTNNGVSGATDGGAVMDGASGQLTINGSTFDANKGYNGGALYSYAPTRVVNSTFVDNTGGNTSSNGDAGAIMVSTGTFINDTITGNECFNGPGCGGAILAGAVTVADTIIAGNLAYESGSHTTATDNCSAGPITIAGPDLQDGTDCTGFTVHGDPRLGPLQNNGGPTDTLEPASTSPAVGAGTNSSCAPVDQRGGARPAPGGGQCDIGAVELNSLTDAAITGSASAQTVTSGAGITYTLTATNNGPDPAVSTIVQDVLPAGAKLNAATASGGTCSGTTTVTCTLGTIAKGATVTIAIAATLNQAGTDTNVATINAPATDAGPGNDSVSFTTAVLPAPPIPTTTAAPVLGGFRQSHSIWREGSAPARIASRPKSKRPPVGTTFSFVLNETASVKLSFARNSHGKCLPHGHQRHWAATPGDASLSLQAHAGTNLVSFDGKIGRSRTLIPGSYTVTIVATNPTGKRSSPSALRFKIAT